MQRRNRQRQRLAKPISGPMPGRLQPDEALHHPCAMLTRNAEAIIRDHDDDTVFAPRGGYRGHRCPSAGARSRQGAGMQPPLVVAIIAGLLVQFPLVLLAIPVLLFFLIHPEWQTLFPPTTEVEL